MNELVAVPYFGPDERYRPMLDAWIASAAAHAPNIRIKILIDRTRDVLVDSLVCDPSPYMDLMRPGQAFDVKGAIMCAAALAIEEPFLMLDADALLVADPADVFARFVDQPIAMPLDLGAIIFARPPRLAAPYDQVRKLCAGVTLFGDVTKRAELVAAYRVAWRELAPILPGFQGWPHLLEQYAWSLVAHRCGCGTLPGAMNWPPHFLGPMPEAIVTHFFAQNLWTKS